MSKKLSKDTTYMVSIKFETILKQIARIERGESTSTFTLKELKSIRDGLLVEING